MTVTQQLHLCPLPLRKQVPPVEGKPFAAVLLCSTAFTITEAARRDLCSVREDMLRTFKIKLHDAVN